MKPAARRKARSLAVQAIYSWQVTGHQIADVEHQYLLEQDVSKIDVSYFQDLVRGVAVNTKQIDEILSPFVARPFDEIDLIEKAVLRLGTYELKFRDDVPSKVSINEAIELAKSFAADDSHRFVNGVLDKVVKVVREQS
ncbi:transcription antitermination factor NusB [Algicola sagamiensis]|uniref:transcription antitermination factor NusB n=1 Tax=Algicola sagamiensis TaxID=163869 RepID=UPI0003652F27|nr:transcription antitermination factor NusB [Algicola sagamiensis]